MPIVNKVTFNGDTIMDISDTTAVASDVASGKYFYGADGVKTPGTSSGGVTPTGTISITQNGTVDVTNYASADVNVTSTINNQNKTVTPTESQQSVTADSGYTGLGTVTVNAVSNTYVGTGVTRQAAKTVTPTTSSQTAVAADVYTTGVVTVEAIPSNYITTSDATASATDIVSGETAYVNGSKVTGSLVIQHYYTGSSAPSSSLGSNGDIYIQA